MGNRGERLSYFTQRFIGSIIVGSFLVLSGCSGTPAKSEVQPVTVVNAAPVLCERIDGPANIRESIGGPVLFTLNDNVMVTCGPLQDDWYPVAVAVELDSATIANQKLRAGPILDLDGEVIGEAINETDLSVTWELSLFGYTHKSNIRPETIVENALLGHLSATESQRDYASFRFFLSEFEFENHDYLGRYDTYALYETGMEDPSPMFRLGLVFDHDKLVAVLHSRPLVLPGSTNYELDRGFDCLVYDDVVDPGDLVSAWNNFVNSVD